MTTNAILVVEDSAESYELIRRALGTQALLEWAKTLKEAYRKLETQTFELVLLDITLPDGNGYELCSMLQASDKLRRIPVVFLTAKTSVGDKIMGFSLGAEDFISKPVEAMELKARVEAKLRKVNDQKQRSQVLRIGDLEINRDTQRVNAIQNNQSNEVDLTPLEFKLLIYMATRAGKVMTRDEILNAIWGENVHVYGRSVDTHISKLRKKLGLSSAPIKSVHGSGYRFDLDDEHKTSTSLDYATWTSGELTPSGLGFQR